MRLSTALTLLSSTISLASATVFIPGLLDCAQSNGLTWTLAGGCDKSDFTCICKAPKLWEYYQNGVQLTCSKAEATEAIQWGVDFCAKANLPVIATAAVAKPTTVAASATVENAIITPTSSLVVSATAKSGGGKLAQAASGVGMLMVAAMAVGM